MSIQRWNIGGYDWEDYPDEDGAWVTWEDHRAEVERLRAQTPNPDDLRMILSGPVDGHDPGMVGIWWAAYDRVRATLPKETE